MIPRQSPPAAAAQRLTADIAIVGAGFAGSILAMICRQCGWEVVLLERGRHPRWVIGESSTPLANLALEEIAAEFDLPELAPFAKFGTWQQHHPDIACGLKRGFTFLHHARRSATSTAWNPRDQLLVAASPHHRIADTHWFRPEFDAHLTTLAVRRGALYLDSTTLTHAEPQSNRLVLRGTRAERPVEVRARYVIDASGARSFLQHAFALPAGPFHAFPKTQAIYSHFSGVERLDQLHPHWPADSAPYPVDDAALHHVFPGGWIWVLHFNNGITSAGAALTAQTAHRLGAQDPSAAWQRLLATLPTVKRQFARATAIRPFIHIPNLSFRTGVVAGPRWALLPSAAGFVDPLLSTGFALTLLGIRRIVQHLQHAPDFKPSPEARGGYQKATLDELDLTATLVGSLYAAMPHPPLFNALSLLYFAAASYAETWRRLGRPAPAFLLADRPAFRHELLHLNKHARRLAANPTPHARDLRDFDRAVRQAIAPIDVAGLADASRQNWYPVDVRDLFAAAPRLDASTAEIQAMLRRCGLG